MKEAFDPKAAMFVCHRWDMIEEKERVKDNAIHNLEFVWPGFDPSQLSCFSTYEAQKHLTAGEIKIFVVLQNYKQIKIVEELKREKNIYLKKKENNSKENYI